MTTKPRTERLDLELVNRGLAESRNKAQALILAREVSIDGKIVDKAGAPVTEMQVISVTKGPRFVSRGGEKLQFALETFHFDVRDQVCADIGASTGGFTDCLLQNGARRVYSIDVGYGQLANRIRDDQRVVVMDRTNARYLESLPEPVDLVTVDASFISLRLLFPAISKLLGQKGSVVALVKPQFEASQREVGRNGVVRDELVRRKVIVDVVDAARHGGFDINALTASPLKGPAGNVEFFAWFVRRDSTVRAAQIERMLDEAIASSP